MTASIHEQIAAKNSENFVIAIESLDYEVGGKSSGEAPNAEENYAAHYFISHRLPD